MELRRRKPNRLAKYDYSQAGVYFVTICVKDRHEMLGEIVGATFGRLRQKQRLSEYGLIIENEINRIDEIYSDSVKLDKYVIMPNHIHMILLLQSNGGRPEVAPTLSRIIQQFKGAVTKKIGFSLWQKLYHDRIIRSGEEYRKIWSYIDTNIQNWEKDCFFKH